MKEKDQRRLSAWKRGGLLISTAAVAAGCNFGNNEQPTVTPTPAASPTLVTELGSMLRPQPTVESVWVTVTPEARPIETATPTSTSTPTETATPTSTATPTETPTPTYTPEAAATAIPNTSITPVSIFENTKGVELKDAHELQAVAPGVSVENIPLEGMTPRRIAGAPGFDGNKNDLGFSTESTLADPGVVSVYRYEESETNASAVLMTGRNEGTLLDADAKPQELDLPANGFVEMTFAYGKVRVGKQIVKFEDLGPDHSHVLVIQGAEGDGKQNTDDSNKVEVSDYDPGKLGYKILAVPLGAGSFKSLEDTLKTVIDAHGVSMSSKGDGGTSKVTLTLWTPIDEQTLSVVRSSHETDQPKNIEKNDLKNITLLFKNWD